jgi:hypothetical protein
MPQDGVEALYGRLKTHAKGANEKVEEQNVYSAYEEFLVATRLCRMALQTDPEKLTEERVELTARLAWAEAELSLGQGPRVQDDLEGAEALAETVAHD